jgi:hypothetical protein
MLGTIKLPNNMRLIQGNLPSSNYEEDKPPPPRKDKSMRADKLDQIQEENDEHIPEHPKPLAPSRNDSAS